MWRQYARERKLASAQPSGLSGERAAQSGCCSLQRARCKEPQQPRRPPRNGRHETGANCSCCCCCCCRCRVCERASELFGSAQSSQFAAVAAVTAAAAAAAAKRANEIRPVRFACVRVCALVSAHSAAPAAPADLQSERGGRARWRRASGYFDASGGQTKASSRAAADYSRECQVIHLIRSHYYSIGHYHHCLYY